MTDTTKYRTELHKATALMKHAIEARIDVAALKDGLSTLETLAPLVAPAQWFNGGAENLDEQRKLVDAVAAFLEACDQMREKGRDRLQRLVDGMSEKWRQERSETGWTLGTLIAELKKLAPLAVVRGFGGADSYRGYYSDLAFAPSNTERTVADLLQECEAALGAVFEGYKGGDFTMSDDTPVWISGYGECSSLRIVGIQSHEGVFLPVTRNEYEEAETK